MNDNNFNNGYNGFDDYGDQGNYYQNSDGNDNYTIPMDVGGMNANNGYGNTSWNGFDNQGYSMNNNSYMDYEYAYYDDNSYMYDDKYSLDYSNSSSNYMDYGYGGYNQNNNDVSLYDISSKINANMDQELLYDSFENNYPNNQYNNGYEYDNKTMPVDVYNNYQNMTVNQDSVNRSYNHGIDTNSSYFHRKGVYDNKLMPTEDIMFDDIYVVRNQLFEEEEKLFSFNDIISLAICVAFAIIMAFLIIRYVAQVTQVDGESMEYNLHNEEVLLLDKLSYRLKDPKRYDIVVFPVKKGNKIYHYIKRIIGLPNETVYIDASKSEIYINGNKLTSEKYGWEPLAGKGTTIDVNNVKLGADEYYCMGDNRNNSLDSRSSTVGPVKRSDLVGKAIFKISPITSFGFISSQDNDDIRNGRKQPTPLKGTT